MNLSPLRDSMKFTQFPLGAQFELDGKAYTKTTPLVGTASDGSGQRVIPRYAMLKPIGVVVPIAPPVAAATLDAQRVLAAFERAHAAYAQLLDAAGTAADVRQQLDARLQAVRRAFLDALR
jgi:hypothetical protein